MCRLISFATTADGLPELAALVKALARSAARDPLLEALGVRQPSHGDGWGFAVAVLKGGAWRFHFMKFGNPIFRDSEGLRGLMRILSDSEGEVFLGVIHARRASKGEAVTWVDAHPHHAIVRDGTEIYVAHNGRVNKEGLGGPLRRSDTVSLALYLARNPPLTEGLRKVVGSGYVESALSLGILIAGLGGAVRVASLNYVSPKVRDEARRKYYAMHLLEGGKYFVATASSTTASFFEESAGIKARELSNGELVFMEAGPEGVSYSREKLIEG